MLVVVSYSAHPQAHMIVCSFQSRTKPVGTSDGMAKALKMRQIGIQQALILLVPGCISRLPTTLFLDNEHCGLTEYKKVPQLHQVAMWLQQTKRT